MSADARRRYALDYGVIAAAACGALFSSGLPRDLALAALGVSAALLWLRASSAARAQAAGQGGVRLPRGVALGALGLALIALLREVELPPRAQRVPYEAPQTAHLPEGIRECLQRPSVEAHLRDLHDRLLRRWSPPAGAPAGQQVTLELVLLPSGAISNPRVLASSHPGLGRSALAALRASHPLPPLGPDVDCLAGAPVRLQLSNPVD